MTEALQKTSDVFDVSKFITMSIKIREMRETLEAQLWENGVGFIWPVEHEQKCQLCLHLQGMTIQYWYNDIKISSFQSMIALKSLES